MKSLKITKIFISLVLILGLAGSSFAMGQNGKKADKNVFQNKAKVEQKYHKKDVKVVNVNAAKKDYRHKKDIKTVKIYKDNHHRKYHKKVGVHFYNKDADFAAKCLGTGLCLIMLAAVNG